MERSCSSSRSPSIKWGQNVATQIRISCPKQSLSQPEQAPSPTGSPHWEKEEVGDLSMREPNLEPTLASPAEGLGTHRGLQSCQISVPGHGFKLRNAELRTQSNPCEGTDVLDKSHSSPSSNTRYHPALPMTCPCWPYPPLPEPSLFTTLPFPFHPLLGFSSTALPFPYLVLVSPRRAHDVPTLPP